MGRKLTRSMPIVICPGIHPPELTDDFLAGLGWTAAAAHQPERFVCPHTDPAYSPWHIWQRLQQRDRSTPLLFISFSAGVVGAIGAARLWHKHGGLVSALIALDGWGVPLVGDFAIHRLSHDWFTHWNFGGPSPDSFYADPGVPHLTLWQSPQSVIGWQVEARNERIKTSTTAANFITDLVQRYEPRLTVET
jgi:hypothetical protein